MAARFVVATQHRSETGQVTAKNLQALHARDVIAAVILIRAWKKNVLVVI